MSTLRIAGMTPEQFAEVVPALAAKWSRPGSRVETIDLAIHVTPREVRPQFPADVDVDIEVAR